MSRKSKVNFHEFLIPDGWIGSNISLIKNCVRVSIRKLQNQMASGNKKSEALCSLLMASLFALSASFQFNDPDWYFWIPLYVTASIVNLVNGVKGYDSNIKKMTKFTFWFGVCLFVKVVIEDFVHGISGFWSLDMRERVVREKFGSGLVICSMFLHLGNSSNSKIHPAQLTKYGMPILVGTAYGISFVFFVLQQDEMRY